MITGIVIPHDADEPLVERKFDNLTDYQQAVGGYIEPAYIENPRMTIFANEEGKVYGLPVNERATCLWWLLSPEARSRDILVGNIVLIGSKRGRGTSTDIPSELIKLLMDTDNYKIEVQTVDSDDFWYGNRAEFDNYFKAAIYGLNLLERWTAATDVRVVPA